MAKAPVKNHRSSTRSWAENPDSRLHQLTLPTFTNPSGRACVSSTASFYDSLSAMIIDAPDQKRPLSRRSSLNDADSLRSGDISPPSYRSYGSRHSLQPMLNEEPPSSDDIPLKPMKRRLEERRWWRGLMYLLMVYAVVSIAVTIPYIVTHRKNSSNPPPIPYQRMKPPDHDTDPNDIGSVKVVPVNVPPEDGQVVGCNIWDYSQSYGYPDYLKYSRLSYCIPRNATDVWLHALNGPEGLVSGQFSVMPNPDTDEHDYMVDVMVTYPGSDYDARNSSAICLMRNEDKWGIGIYTPPNVEPHPSMNYRLIFYVPQSSGTLHLTDFNVSLPWFQHSFHDLNKTLLFENVQIEGTASPIDGTLSGRNVNITTTDASITGIYSASQSLSMQTSVGQIDTNITLGSVSGSPTSLFMKSSKGPFSATITLANDTLNSSLSGLSTNLLVNPSLRPTYSAKVLCDDSPITVAFRHDDSLDFSDLDVQVTTSLNRALVLLDSKFEGSFDLHAQNGSVLVADLDGDDHLHSQSFYDTFPEKYYKRSLELQQYSLSHARGCVKRNGPSVSRRDGVDADNDSAPDGETVANIVVNNKMALVALGFLQPGQTPPIMKDLGLS